MEDSYYNQGPQGNSQYPLQGRHGSSAGYSSAEQVYYPSPPQNNYGSYRPPEDDSYRGSPRGSPSASNMQVGHAYEGSYYGEDEPRSRHHRHHEDRDRSHSRRRSRSRSTRSRNGSESHRGGGEKGVGHRSGGHKTEKTVAATVAGGALGALAVHELSGGHHDIATVVGGLVGAFAGNKLEKNHEKKKGEKLRRESESSSGPYSLGPQYGNSGYLVRDEHGARTGSATRSRGYEDDNSESDSDESRSRRRHHHH